MKKMLFVLWVFSLFSCTSNRMALYIPANQVVEIDYPNYPVFKVSLKNKSGRQVDVAVLTKEDEQQVRGFGLGKKADVDVFVERKNKLVLRNRNNADVTIDIEVSEEDPTVFEREGEYIRFTLRNRSRRSIPLIIPGVMNPNLSPNSRSGVDLKIGQEILFRAEGKNYILLTVNESIREGEEIDVAALLNRRKAELGLED